MKVTTLAAMGLLYSLTASPVLAQQFHEDESIVTELDEAPVSADEMSAPSYTDLKEVPEVPLKKAMDYLNSHRSLVQNMRYMAIIDYTQNANKKRLYVIDRKTGVVEKLLVANGRGSDPDHDGFATSFSNDFESHQTSLGFYRTGDTYYGGHGLSLYLDGLSPTNSNARARSIVMHGAPYVSPDLEYIGRSFGCPAIEPSAVERIIGQLKGGSLIYAWGGQ